MINDIQKPVIGFTCGDLNGIGIEVIIKVLSDARINDLCTPVIFASNKVINFYRKSLPDVNFSYAAAKDLSKLNTKQVNVYNCWEEEVSVTPGVMNETGGKYALASLRAATNALKAGQIHAMVTLPVHKKNIQTDGFSHPGHTGFLKEAFNADEVVMVLSCDKLRVALVTEHIPLKAVASKLSKDLIVHKIEKLNHSLKKDFGLDKPKIAVLALNPHAGDEGLLGDEEMTIIKPALIEAKQKNLLAFGPFSADAFFARSHFEKFDAVLAMYHDQGLIPFKTLAQGQAVNYTAGLPVVRTSPDHGTAFDIAGKGIANPESAFYALYSAIDILKQRAMYDANHLNPLRKRSASVIANAVDEKLEENDNGG